jgi:EAL domain-containing protein (putative c-di-GMP-specific phosphodiesterase class I)
MKAVKTTGTNKTSGVAEEIETQAQLAHVREEGCTEVQGICSVDPRRASSTANDWRQSFENAGSPPSQRGPRDERVRACAGSISA